MGLNNLGRLWLRGISVVASLTLREFDGDVRKSCLSRKKSVAILVKVEHISVIKF